jgi:pimeloyl-ACP methyl ester carboxylesterase
MTVPTTLDDAQTIGYQERSIRTPAGNLYARDYPGAGPAFLLLHGFPDNLRIYDQLAPLLAAAGRRVVSFDFLGFGASDKPGSGHSFGQQVEDVAAVVEALKLDRLVPVGHDAGGPVALNFALQAPERIVEIGLLNCFYGSAPSLRFPEFIAFFATPALKRLQAHFLENAVLFVELLQYQRARFVDDVLGETEAALWDEHLLPVIWDNFVGESSAMPAFAEMTADLYAEVARNDARLAELARLDVPIRLVWGGTDPYLTPALAADIAKQLRNPIVTVVDGASHWPMVGHAEEVAAALLSPLS